MILSRYSHMLFSINNGRTNKILPTKLRLERDIQNLFQGNLSSILDIHFLASEYATSFGGRIDTLGIDNNGSPVIIEYKRVQNDSVINQGLSYLRWLLDHKEKFELLVREKSINVEIDWRSPRVICVAESYNKFDLDTAELLPFSIELYRFQLYEGDLLLLERASEQKLKISTSNIFAREKERSQIFKEKINYSLEDHLSTTSEKMKILFEQFKERVTALDEAIIEEPKAKYIAYKLTTNFVDIVVQKNSLKIFINLPSGKLDDPQGLARDLTQPKKVGRWGNGDYELRFENEEVLDYVMNLVIQSYEFNK
jgi:predicted transport protein